MSEFFSNIPSRSSEGLAALDIFYIGLNEVNIYVEDIDQENLYEFVFGKILPSIKFCKIFPLGGKPAVLAHARDPANLSLPTKKIYLLDKDFDDFLGKIVSLDNIYYLDRFCIENYLLEELAIVNVVIETYPKTKKHEIVKKLDINQKVDEIYSALRELFTLFYCVQFLELGIKNCKSKPEEFCSKTQLWEVNQSTINNYLDNVIALAKSKCVIPELVNPLTDERFIKIINTDCKSLISGKFVLAMIFHYVKKHFSLGSIKFDSFVYRVAKNSQFDSLKPLAEKIMISLSNSSPDSENHDESSLVNEMC